LGEGNTIVIVTRPIEDGSKAFTLHLVKHCVRLKGIDHPLHVPLVVYYRGKEKNVPVSNSFGPVAPQKTERGKDQ
jgi:hypothetical protein